MARQPPELTEQQRTLGRHLAALREAAGLYQTDVARAVRCPATAQLSRMQRRAPSYPMLTSGKQLIK